MDPNSNSPYIEILAVFEEQPLYFLIDNMLLVFISSRSNTWIKA